MATSEWTHYHEKKWKSVTCLRSEEVFTFNFHNIALSTAKMTDYEK